MILTASRPGRGFPHRIQGGGRLEIAPFWGCPGPPNQAQPHGYSDGPDLGPPARVAVVSPSSGLQGLSTKSCLLQSPCLSAFCLL